MDREKSVNLKEGLEKARDNAGRKVGLLRRFFRFFGISIAPAPGQLLVLTRRFPFVLLGGAVGFLFASGGLVYYTSSPAFCKSCHFIRPYVESWQTSTHKMVACTKCHFPPGIGNFIRGKVIGLTEAMRLLTGTQSPRPMAEIEDASCLREGCHETRLLKDKVLFKGKYHFDHAPHMTTLRRGKKLRCTSCHSQIAQGEHIAVTETVCFICHFKDHSPERMEEPVGGCTACHDVPSEPIQVAAGVTFEHKPFVDRGVPCLKCHSDSIQGKGEVSKQVCRECHDQPEKLTRYGDLDFLHKWHVTQRKVECFRCHAEVRIVQNHDPRKMAESCSNCHSSGHEPQAMLYAGTGGKEVNQQPSRHFLAQVDCIACHGTAVPGHQASLDKARASGVSEEVCLRCHGTTVKGMLEEWKTTLSDALQEAKQHLAEAQKALDGRQADPAKKAEIEALLSLAQHNCEFVEKARGVHNPDYALELLDKAKTDAEKAARLASELAVSQAVVPNKDKASQR